MNAELKSVLEATQNLDARIAAAVEGAVEKARAFRSSHPEFLKSSNLSLQLVVDAVLDLEGNVIRLRDQPEVVLYRLPAGAQLRGPE